MLVKVKDGAAVRFPYTVQELRRDNKGVSFPEKISHEVLESYGVYAVVEADSPEFDPKTHTTQQTVALVDGQWKQVWTVTPLPEAVAAENVRNQRSALLRQTDWMALSDVAMTEEMAQYRQALRDVTLQSGFPYNVEWPIKPE